MHAVRHCARATRRAGKQEARPAPQSVPLAPAGLAALCPSVIATNTPAFLPETRPFSHAHPPRCEAAASPRGAASSFPCELFVPSRVYVSTRSSTTSRTGLSPSPACYRARACPHSGPVEGRSHTRHPAKGLRRSAHCARRGRRYVHGGASADDSELPKSLLSRPPEPAGQLPPHLPPLAETRGHSDQKVTFTQNLFLPLRTVWPWVRHFLCFNLCPRDGDDASRVQGCRKDYGR